jgi:Domain of unknown function (DUF4389)
MAAVPDQSLYPVRYEVEASAPQRRWTVLLRMPLSIPALIFSLLVQSWLVLAIWAAILVSGRIPRWLFEFQVAVNRWQFRAVSYFLLLTDQYPPFEGDHPVQYEVESAVYVRSRWKVVIWKIISSIPLGFVAFLLVLTLLIVIPIIWVVALVTARVPVRLHQYVAGVLRWIARLQAYVVSLTDTYPPFRLAPEAGAASRRTHMLGSAAGLIVTISLCSIFGALVAFGGQRVEVDVEYDALLEGEFRSEGVHAEVIVARVQLMGAADPVESLDPYIVAEEGNRLVAFDLTVNQRRSSTESVPIKRSSYSLRSDAGAKYEALLVTVDGRPGETKIGRDERANIHVIFQMPVEEAPIDLRFDLLNYIDVPRVGETIVYHLR